MGKLAKPDFCKRLQFLLMLMFSIMLFGLLSKMAQRIYTIFGLNQCFILLITLGKLHVCVSDVY